MAVVIEQQQNGTGSGSSVTTSAALGVVNAHKYMVFVGSKTAETVSSVVGMGLTWTLLNAQCSGRSQTEISVFEGTGTPNPAPGTITANFAGNTTSAVIVAYRMSGVDTVTPILQDEGANTNGEDDPASCSGGSDDDTPTLSLDVQQIGSLILGVFNTRNRTITPGTGYVTETDVQADTDGDASSVRITSKTSTATGATTVDALASGVTDWSMIAIEFNAEIPTGDATAGVDAILLATQTVTPSVDSLIRDQQTETILADALIEKETQNVSSVDALIRKQQTETVLVDSLVLKTQTETILADALILQGTAIMIAVDSLIQATQTETAIIDALIKIIQTNDITNDSILVNRNSATPTIDALLLAIQTLTPTIDGIVVNRNTETITNDAILVNRPSVTATVDAMINRIVNAQISVDGITPIKPTAVISVDALKSFAFLELRTVDAILSPIVPNPVAISVDGIINQAGQVQIFVDPLIIGPLTATANVDATVETPNVQFIITSDAIIVSRPSVSPLIDAKIVIRSTRDALADSILINRKTLPITVDGQVELTSQNPVSVDVTIELRQTTLELLDSILVNRNTAQSIVDAGLLFEIQKQVSVDSNIHSIIPLDVILDANIILKNIQEPILVDSLLAVVPTQFLVSNARLLAIQAQIVSIDAIILRASVVQVDAKIGINQIGRTVLVDSHVRSPRRIRTISEIRDNIFSTSIIRRETRSTF